MQNEKLFNKLLFLLLFCLTWHSVSDKCCLLLYKNPNAKKDWHSGFLFLIFYTEKGNINEY